MVKVMASYSIIVKCSPETLWDYTQNWDKRTEWDRSIKSAKYLSQDAPISVSVIGIGGVSFQVTYKVSDRPRLTTLVMSEIRSPLVKGGGGSWKYKNLNGQTRWTQHNTLVLKDGLMGMLIRPFAALMLSIMTKQMMNKAKAIVEKNGPNAGG